MKASTTIIVVVSAAVVGFGVWWFFIRKRPAVAVPPSNYPPSTYSPGASVPQYPVVGTPQLPAPVGTPGGGKVTVGGAINQGVALAATAGCAAAAAAYTGGAAMPLCGLAGPLAVQGVQALGTAGKAIGSAVSKICIPIPFVHKC